MRIFQTTDPEYLSLQKEDFKLHTREEEIHDAKFETKPVGFFKDAMLRFGKNTASIIAFAIICIIVILSAFGPMMNGYGYNDQDLDRANLPARIKGCEGINLLNGSTVLKNRRKDNLDNTEKYPEGCILDVFNETVVNGVEMCDIRIDTYIYSGYGDDYFWFGTDQSWPRSLDARVAGVQNIAYNRIRCRFNQCRVRRNIWLYRRLLWRHDGHGDDALCGNSSGVS